MIKYMKIKKIETIVVILWFREESKRKKKNKEIEIILHVL